MKCLMSSSNLWLLAAVFVLMWVTGCTGATPPDKPVGKAKRVREPAVAGVFYPQEEAALSQLLERLLAAAPPGQAPNVKAVICPHAGYAYSGPTAACAYKELVGREFAHVILLAPSHYAWFQGASVSAADEFKTPLGTVPIWAEGRERLKQAPFLPDAPCRVQRPAWSAQSSRAIPPAGEDTPDTWEHSDEVQVPFLQKVLPHCQLLPIVLGEVEPAEVAAGLAPLLDDKTLLVISSDLSHFHDYDSAKTMDTRCLGAVTNLNIEQMRTEEACGKTPILTLLHLAKQKGWQARLLDYRNSGDTSGDKSRGVVGYGAVVFFDPKPTASVAATPAAQGYTKEDKRFLMDLAAQSVRTVVTTGRLPEIDEKTVPARLLEKKGCFVTLTKHGELRGCIGHILPQEALYQAVMDNARSAALRDTRFSPVETTELGALEFEVSVLTVPQPLAFKSPEDLLAKLESHRDGVVLQISGHSATFLPQVWEQLPDKVAFLEHLSRKAGAEASDWRRPGVKVSIYQVEAFKPAELR